MAGIGLFLFGVLPIAIVVGIICAVVAARGRASRLRFDESAYPGLQALRRSTIWLRGIGIVLGLLAGVAVIPLGASSPWAFAAPLVTGFVVVVAILVGQQLSYAQARTGGAAAVETRRVADYLPVRLARWAGGAAVALLLVTMFTTLAASPDDLGRPGRVLTGAWFEQRWEADAAGVLVPQDIPRLGTVSPFPGSFYTVPVVVSLAVLALAVVVGLVLTARRPRNGSDPELVRVDDAIRRITAEGLVAAGGAGASGAILAVAGVAYPRFGGFGQIPVYVASSYLLAAIALGALVSGLAFAVVLLVPGNGDRR